MSEPEFQINEQEFHEFQALMQRLETAETDDFLELATLLGRDPKTDLIGADLSGTDLKGKELIDANLNGVNLSGADLSNANLSNANLSGADLREANFYGSNLSSANLNEATVHGTKFGNNLGLSEAAKSDLRDRGALFNDSAPLFVTTPVKAVKYEAEIPKRGRRESNSQAGEVRGNNSEQKPPISTLVRPFISTQVDEADLFEMTSNVTTVSRLQVALQSQASQIQSRLTETALQSTTTEQEGLFELLQQTAGLLLENADFWTHVLASSQTVDGREEAEILFNRFSMQERAKFSAETLTNINGAVTLQPSEPPRSDENPAYIVVTLLLGTADDEPLFNEIYSASLLRDVLEDIALMRPRFLLAFELLWTPEDSADSLTESDLAAEYADLVPIA
jgi:uncharacterized protein YjbI with pentapeptide repeats